MMAMVANDGHNLTFTHWMLLRKLPATPMKKSATTWQQLKHYIDKSSIN